MVMVLSRQLGGGGTETGARSPDNHIGALDQVAVGGTHGVGD